MHMHKQDELIVIFNNNFHILKKLLVTLIYLSFTFKIHRKTQNCILLNFQW